MILKNENLNILFTYRVKRTMKHSDDYIREKLEYLDEKIDELHKHCMELDYLKDAEYRVEVEEMIKALEIDEAILKEAQYQKSLIK